MKDGVLRTLRQLIYVYNDVWAGMVVGMFQLGISPDKEETVVYLFSLHSLMACSRIATISV